VVGGGIVATASAMSAVAVVGVSSSLDGRSSLEGSTPGVTREPVTGGDRVWPTVKVKRPASLLTCLAPVRFRLAIGIDGRFSRGDIGSELPPFVGFWLVGATHGQVGEPVLRRLPSVLAVGAPPWPRDHDETDSN
jgi:hypothetical protein